MTSGNRQQNEEREMDDLGCGASLVPAFAGAMGRVAMIDRTYVRYRLRMAQSRCAQAGYIPARSSRCGCMHGNLQGSCWTDRTIRHG